MGESLGVLAETVPMEGLDRVDEPRVQRAPALQQQATIRDLLRERMLEGVLKIRKQPRLVEELGRLQMFEPSTELVLREFGNRLEQWERHVLADDRRDLKEPLVFRGQTINARRQHDLHAGRDPERLDRLRELISSPLPDERLCLHQRSDRLLQKERVAVLDEQLLERTIPISSPRRASSSSPALSAGSASSRSWV